MAVLCVRTYQGGSKSRTPCALCRVGWQQSRVNRYCINVGPFHLYQAAEWTKSMALLPPIKYTCFSRLPPPPTHPPELFFSPMVDVQRTLVRTGHGDMWYLNHIRFCWSFRFNLITIFLIYELIHIHVRSTVYCRYIELSCFWTLCLGSFLAFAK